MKYVYGALVQFYYKGTPNFSEKPLYVVDLWDI
jgi:hypothetical protein